MSEPMMVPEEVCEQLRISRNTLYTLLAAGELTGYKVGGQWRFTQKDIDAYLYHYRKSRLTVNLPRGRAKMEPPRPRNAAECGYVPGMKVV